VWECPILAALPARGGGAAAAQRAARGFELLRPADMADARTHHAQSSTNLPLHDDAVSSQAPLLAPDAAWAGGGGRCGGDGADGGDRPPPPRGGGAAAGAEGRRSRQASPARGAAAGGGGRSAPASPPPRPPSAERSFSLSDWIPGSPDRTTPAAITAAELADAAAAAADAAAAAAPGPCPPEVAAAGVVLDAATGLAVTTDERIPHVCLLTPAEALSPRAVPPAAAVAALAAAAAGAAAPPAEAAAAAGQRLRRSGSFADLGAEEAPAAAAARPPPTHFFSISPDACSNPTLYWLGSYGAGTFDLSTAEGPHRLDLGDVLYAPNLMEDDQARALTPPPYVRRCMGGHTQCRSRRSRAARVPLAPHPAS